MTGGQNILKLNDPEVKMEGQFISRQLL